MTKIKQEPHLRLTKQQLAAAYKNKLLTVKGYIQFWIKASKKDGWKFRTTVTEFCEELGITRSAFYKALAQLKTEDAHFRFELHGEIEMWFADEVSTNEDTLSTNEDTLSTKVDTLSTKVDTLSTKVDRQSTKVDRQSTKVENETQKSSPELEHSDSPTLINSLSDPFRSLSDRERENFESFPEGVGTNTPSPKHTKTHLNPEVYSSSSGAQVGQDDDYRSDAPRIDNPGTMMRKWLELGSEERGKFREWAIAQANTLPIPPTLPDRWVDRNFKSLFERWLVERLKPKGEIVEIIVNPDNSQTWVYADKEGNRTYVPA